MHLNTDGFGVFEPRLLLPTANFRLFLCTAFQETLPAFLAFRRLALEQLAAKDI